MQYQTASQTTNMKKAIIFVPYWIETVLKRNNCTLKDILDYEVLRRFIPLNDLSGLLGFQQVPEISQLKVTDNSLLSRWESTAGTRHRQELDSTVVPLSYSIEKETLERLKNTSLDGIGESKSTFRVTDIERDSMVVVMYEGFIDSIKQDSVKLSLVTQLLSLSYVYCRAEEVSKTELFRTYVDLLQVSTLVETA